MKKLIAVLGAVLALGLGISPAQAQTVERQIGDKCRSFTLNGHHMQVCTQLNLKEPFRENIEALNDWTVDYDFTYEGDYIRLLRVNPDGGSSILRQNETDTIRTMSPTVGCCHSTDWYDLCQAPGTRYYYTTTRWHAWLVVPNAPDVGTGWQVMSSFQVQEPVCGDTGI